MNKKNIPVEFVYQLFALIIAIIIVHAFYVSVVRKSLFLLLFVSYFLSFHFSNNF